MNDDKLYEKLTELALGQQRIEGKLDTHLENHELAKIENQAKFDHITKMYIPAFGFILPVISFILSWLHARHLGGPH